MVLIVGIVDIVLAVSSSQEGLKSERFYFFIYCQSLDISSTFGNCSKDYSVEIEVAGFNTGLHQKLFLNFFFTLGLIFFKSLLAV